MKVLFDTNVILDVLLYREPYVATAAKLFALVDRGKIQGSICATAVTTVHYIAEKAVGRRQARKHLRDLLVLFPVSPVDHAIHASALKLDFADFEDAVVHEAARVSGMAGIVTRNGKDFTRAELPLFEPDELLAAITAARD